MTTIAYKDGILAADSQVTYGNIIVEDAVKIRKLTGHRIVFLVAAAGSLSKAELFFRNCAANIEDVSLCEDGSTSYDCAEVRHEDSDNFEGLLIVKTDEKIEFFTYSNNGVAIPFVMKDFFATGTGAEIAKGAMLFGASAEEAVQAGIKMDIYSGGKIHKLELDDCL